MLLAIDEMKEAIDIYLAKGYKKEEVSIAFAAMYCDNQIDYEDLKNAIHLLDFVMFKEFENMEEEERKAFLREKYNFKKKTVM